MKYLYRDLLASTLQKYFIEQADYWAEEYFIQAISHIQQTITGGKLLRGCLYLQAACYKTEPLQCHLQIAMALEIVHMAFLIHDDIMDESTERRGNPTTHYIFKESVRNVDITNRNKNHYGYSQAISNGDLLIFLAQDLLVQGSIALEDKTIVPFTQKEWAQVCFGQMLDMQLGILDFHEPNLEDKILDIYRKKTARYTFSLPLILGSKTQLIPQSIQNILYRAGEYLGMIFQIQDDFLDIFGDSHKVKKTLGQDIKEGKKTLYLYWLYQNLTSKEKEYFIILKNTSQPLNLEQIHWLRDQISFYHIDVKVQSLVDDYEQKVRILMEELINYPCFYSIIKSILVGIKRTH